MKHLCSIKLVPYGKRYKVKVGSKLTKKSTKSQVLEKLVEYSNILAMGQASVDMIVQEDLPLFPEFEKEIFESPIIAFLYAHFFVKSRLKRAEKIIKKDPAAFYLYISHTLTTRSIDLEKCFIESPQLIYNYCKNVFKYKKIPEDIHNAMLAHAITNPNCKFVRKYFKMKKNRVKV